MLNNLGMFREATKHLPDNTPIVVTNPRGTLVPCTEVEVTTGRYNHIERMWQKTAPTDYGFPTIVVVE